MQAHDCDPVGMHWISALELALLRKPGVAHISDGLPGLLTGMHAPYWISLCQLPA